MSQRPHNGDGRVLPEQPRDHQAAGHAALLLVESLIHHLISAKILTVAEAVEIIEVAAEVEREVGAVANDGLAPLTPPSSLKALADSLRLDL